MDFISGAMSAGNFLQVPGMQSHAPQSGQIFGILRLRRGPFSSRILKAAKQTEIETAKATIV